MACPFAWYELMTTDTAAAASFYTSVVGWSTMEVGSAEMPYSTFNVGAIGVAGLMALPKSAGPVPAWLGYIHVPDVDAAAQQVVAAGGKLVRGPTDIPGMLRFAVVLDADGAPFTLFTPDSRMPSNPERPTAGSPGTIGWHELLANDGAKAFAFYASQFGWTRGEAHDMGPMGIYHTFATGAEPVGGIMTRPPSVSGPFWNFYFNVDGMDAATARIEAAGGVIFQGPHQVPGGGWIVQARDPQGAFFGLLSATQ